MINVIIPEKFSKEFRYTLDVLLVEFLGLNINYQLTEKKAKNYTIILENGKKIHFRNAFFSKFSQHEDYLKSENIPKFTLIMNSPFNLEKDVPVIFGSNRLVVEDEFIECGLDIVASSFFMLTRWEEYVINRKDKHNRFDSRNSLAYKHGFLDRPIVNEYLEILWNMIASLDSTVSRKKNQFSISVTHDVDSIRYLKNPKDLIRAVGIEILKKRNILNAFSLFKLYYQIKKGEIEDPYNTFTWIMDASEKNNITSEFYFMSGGKTRYDNHYKIKDKETKQLVESIRNRGHVIGFHPSYDTYSDQVKFKNELNLLEDHSKTQVKGGRQHYLRFSVPETWQIWEDSNLKYDSTLSYADEVGFRSGTCFEYDTFNILTRKKLNLKERPLIIMEVTLASYKKLSPDEMDKEIQKYKEICRRYNGMFTVLWHNSNLNTKFWRDYKYVYLKMIKNSSDFN